MFHVCLLFKCSRRLCRDCLSKSDQQMTGPVGRRNSPPSKHLHPHTTKPQHHTSKKFVPAIPAAGATADSCDTGVLASWPLMNRMDLDEWTRCGHFLFMIQSPRMIFFLSFKPNHSSLDGKVTLLQSAFH